MTTRIMITALDDLKQFNTWIAYKLVPDRKRPGKTDKLPVNPHTGEMASTTDMKTWGSYQQAEKRAKQDNLAGVGYVFTELSGIVGIDLDSCIDDAGNLAPWAADIVKALDSYTELSPSGTGLHILAKGALPPENRKKGAIEMYSSGRFFTVTGNHWPGTPQVIEERPAQIIDLHRVVFSKPEARPDPAPVQLVSLADSELIEKAKSAANGAKFAELWAGRINGYPSQSEGDQALCNMLAFWAGNDAIRIDSLFRQSGLYRPEKWDKRHYSSGETYGQHTISKAIASTTETYRQNGAGNLQTNVNGSNSKDPVIIDDDEEPEPLPDCTPLPEDIPVFERQHISHWLGQYIDYALKVSPMTPGDFHESAGLWLASVAIARRLKLPMAFGDIYPNLFVTWVASTTLYRKTTALDVAKKMARRLMPYLLAPQDSTPEAMLSDLAGREPHNMILMPEADQELWQKSRNFAAQKGWTLDELSSLLASSGKDYNAGLVESLLRLYDCDEWFSRSTRSSGLVIVKNAYLSLLGASTPGALSMHLNNRRLWSMGFWPRFAILTPLEKPAWVEPTEAIEPPQLTEALVNLMKRLPKAAWPDPPSALNVTFAAGVHQDWQRYNKAVSYDLLTDDLDERLHGTYGRLPVQVLKVATILAALDWSKEPAPVIDNYHLAHAIAVCERWRASAHRALAMANESEFNALQERIIRQLGKAGPNGATLRTLYKAMKDRTPDQIEDALRQLEKAGMVEQVEKGPGEKGGRPTVRYKLV